MANEAVIIELLGDGGDPVEYIVADGTTIAKGTILKLADPRTALASTADGEICVGIAAVEKLANDGCTKIPVYTHGIFDLKDSGAGITLGAMVTIGGANTIKAAAAGEAETGDCFGRCLETAAASEVVSVLVRL